MPYRGLICIKGCDSARKLLGRGKDNWRLVYYSYLKSVIGEVCTRTHENWLKFDNQTKQKIAPEWALLLNIETWLGQQNKKSKTTWGYKQVFASESIKCELFRMCGVYLKVSSDKEVMQLGSGGRRRCRHDFVYVVW